MRRLLNIQGRYDPCDTVGSQKTTDEIQFILRHSGLKHAGMTDVPTNIPMPEINFCPCNPSVPYAECCALLLAGDRLADSPEALMRSRYTAFVVRGVDYLLRTWHPSTRPANIDPATIPDWCGLHIVRTENGGESDNQGVVEFIATALSQDTTLCLHEVSRFVKEDGKWLYVDGDIKGDAPSVEKRGSKVGRNDPCPCGSGKKSKRCCGP